MTRRETREAAFVLVFEWLIRGDEPDDILDTAEAELFLSEDSIAIFRGVYQRHDELCEIISGYSEKRQVSRIPKVCLAILEIAVYEILYCDLVPENVAINEAVLLSKKYGFEADSSFVNGVLGSYSRSRSENK